MTVAVGLCPGGRVMLTVNSVPVGNSVASTVPQIIAVWMSLVTSLLMPSGLFIDFHLICNIKKPTRIYDRHESV
jgi:hypothetical protein